MLNPTATFRGFPRHLALRRAVRRFLGGRGGGPSDTHRDRDLSTPVGSAGEDQRFRRHADVVGEAVGGKLLLVQLAHGTTFRLNGTGRAVWELAIQGLTLPEIAGRLASVYGVCHEELRRDAGALLDEMVRGALLETHC